VRAVSRFQFTAGIFFAMLCACLIEIDQAVAGSAAHVYLFRGLFGLSPGMDILAQKLNHRGIHATVHPFEQAGSVAAEAVRNYKSRREAPIILIGHSSGGREVLPMAAQLGRAGVPVALVVPIDAPSTTPPSSNAHRLINLYLSNGVGAAVARGKDFHGQLQNVDLRNDPSMGHFAIQSDEKIHRQIIGYVTSAIAAPSVPAMPVAPESTSAPQAHANGAAAKGKD